MPTRKSPQHAQRAPHAPHAPRARHVDLDDGNAFVPDYRDGFVAPSDYDAEALGEEFIASATSAEAVAEDARDEMADEEVIADELEDTSAETVDLDELGQ